MQQKINFIIIDDSNEDCYIVQKKLESLGSSFNIKVFLSAQEAFEYISKSELSDHQAKNIIILDIYMPLMDGFKFIEEFENLPQQVQDNYTICALTSSISKSYNDKIATYSSVKYSLEKPIKTENLLELIAGK